MLGIESGSVSGCWSVSQMFSLGSGFPNGDGAEGGQWAIYGQRPASSCRFLLCGSLSSELVRSGLLVFWVCSGVGVSLLPHSRHAIVRFPFSDRGGACGPWRGGHLHLCMKPCFRVGPTVTSALQSDSIYCVCLYCLFEGPERLVGEAWDCLWHLPL